MTKVLEDFDLTSYNTFHVPVRAEYFSSFGCIDDLMELSSHFGNHQKLIIGGGSNLLFTKDVGGLVLQNKIRGIEIISEDENFVFVNAGAGVVWHELVLFAVNHQWGGIENLSLIPGFVGAAPIQNIGAYGVELCNVFEELEAFHLKDREIHKIKKDDCEFGYRKSVFKNKSKGQYAILNITLRLNKKPVFNIGYGAIQKQLEQMNTGELSVKAISDAVIQIRQSKLPDPAVIGNAGSFFKNPIIDFESFQEVKKIFPEMPSYPAGEKIKVPAAWLIEQCGFKGIRVGNTGCYKNQPLVLVNYGNATGSEIFEFSERIIQTVREKFQITLEREVNIF